MVEAEAPAFYARRGGRRAEWWTLLHPPYTVWHLSYCVLGAAMAQRIDWVALVATVVALFLAVGVAAHALDEATGRPLRTTIGGPALTTVSVIALGGAVVLGGYGAFWWHGTNWPLVAAIPVGAVLVVGYNLELFGGQLHNDATFALGWGGFPVVVGYVAQSPGLRWEGIVAATCATAAGVATTYAQRYLSAPARDLRRRVVRVEGRVAYSDREERIDRAVLLAPLERTLRALSWGMPLVALAALLSHV